MTTATYYDGVRVPAANLVGEENEGWRMITTQLNHERVGLAAFCGLASRLYEEVVEWAAEQGTLSEPWVRSALAQAHARLEAIRLLNWRMANHLDGGELGPAEPSAVKVFGTEGHRRRLSLAPGCRRTPGLLRPGSPGAVLAGTLEQASRAAQINTFGGGVNEVQREIVAAAGLKMARRAR